MLSDATAIHAKILVADRDPEKRDHEAVKLEKAANDPSSVVLLLNRYHRTIFNVARRILKDDSEAEDLVQEVSLLVFQRAHLFDPSKSSAISWIIQLAYHRAINRLRYLSHRQHYDRPELIEDVTPSRYSSVVDVVTARDLLEKLRHELTAEQLQTLELHFFEDLTFAEIAEKTGQTYGNVRNHYYRGIKRLREHVFSKKQR